MKRISLLIIIILTVGLILMGCSGSEDGSVSSDSGSGTETSFNFTLTSLKKQQTPSSVLGWQASFTADQVMTGQLQATNTDTSDVQVFDWSIYFDEDTYAVQSNKTIILPPGTYEFALLLIKGDQQYAGNVAGVVISDGTFDVPMTISPIIGNTVTDVTLLASLAEFKFQYDPTELAAASLVNPQMGILVNGGAEAIYGINPATGISDTWINLDEGEGTIQLKLYDGSLQVGRSITAQESVIVTAGLNITMDLVALHGETTFALTEAGGDAHFSFNIPSEVVDEAGGLGNLQAFFQITGLNNPLDENVLTLVPDGSGDFEAAITLTNKQFGNVTMALTFNDIAAGELLGMCTMPAVLDTTQRTLNCNITLRRRAVIGGSLLATLGINVLNGAGEPVAGALVSENDNILGITGSGAFGTAGYLKIYHPTGPVTIRAETATKYGDSSISLSSLGLENIDITLDQDSIPSNIIGSWVTIDNFNPSNPGNLTFYGNGLYVQYTDCSLQADPDPNVNLEIGTYISSNTRLTVTGHINNGCGGLDNDENTGPPDPLNISFTGDASSFTMLDYSFTLFRVRNPASPIVGSWRMDPDYSPNNPHIVTFYDNGYYIAYDDCTLMPPGEADPFVDLEIGTYTNTSSLLTITSHIQNGCGGFDNENNDGISPPLNISFGGGDSTMTLLDYGVVFHRVGE